MPHKFAFINYKGGVGKTSLAVNVASHLALAGKRTLLVDLDTQSNSSVWLMGLATWREVQDEEIPSICTYLTDASVSLEEARFRNVFRTREDAYAGIPLDIIPCNFQLIEIEDRSYRPKSDNPVFFDFFKSQESFIDEYDYVIYDCPPNLLEAARCGIFSADSIIVPANPDALSQIGLVLLVEKLDEFRALSDLYLYDTCKNHAEIRSIIFNAIKTGSDFAMPRIRMQMQLNQLRYSDSVHLDSEIMDHTVRDAIVVKRAVTAGLPVAMLDRMTTQGNVVEDFANVARALAQIAEMPLNPEEEYSRLPELRECANQVTSSS
ncbi:MAG: AAA family ATPase [Opitutales bacterium]|nr:AAA family ATPase [Opitutales bacterium]NRA26832.1 AAA family ATPase [Opitutales bacterium]